MTTIPTIYALLLSVSMVPYVAAQEPAESAEQRYSRCMEMAAQAPDRAINEALIWQNEQGGIPARHCEALGLFHAKEYEEAAARLEAIAEDMRVGKGMPVRAGRRLVATAPMLADMFAQAANSWLLAGEIVRAEAAVDTALALTINGSSQEMELLVDRARIAAADEDFVVALQDLEKVLAQDPGRKDILVLVAASARGSGNLIRAEEALGDYMAAFPNRADGHLERGNLYDLQGLKEEARRSWLKVLEITEAGPDADAARANLERIDVVKE